MILLDTHIWIWFIQGAPSLRTELREQIEASPENCLLSAVSIWEAMILSQKGKIEFDPDPETFLRGAVSTNQFRGVPITHEVAFLSRTLELGYDDPGDCFLAATAVSYGVPLATDDKRLQALAWLDTI